METRFYNPQSIEEAAALLQEPDTVALNGGSDLVLDISAKKIQPRSIVFLRDVEGLGNIVDDGEYIRIGGSVTYRQMQKSPLCNNLLGLMEAVLSLGSPAIRNVATPAGNIATAAPSADCATMLLALDAELLLVSSRGERVLPQREVYIKAYKTAIEKDEIIKEIRFKKPSASEGTGYCRVSRRKAQDIAKVIAGAVIGVDEEGKCVKASVSLGALNATAVKAKSVEEKLIGLSHKEAVAMAESFFPAEAGLRESYFKHYKEQITCHVVAKAIDMAFCEAEKEATICQ